MRRFRIVWGSGGLAVALAGGMGWLHYRATRFDDDIAQAAARQSLDFYLVKALVFEESWFRAGIRGPAGEFGLMQITLAAARDFSNRQGLQPFAEDRLLEPHLNLEIGCWYLRQSLDRYRDTPDPILFALLRYNAGEARADSWAKLALAKPVPPDMPADNYYLSFVTYPGTRDYASRVLRRSRARNFWF